MLDVFGVLLGLLDGLVLQDDGGGQVFHELVEFDESALDLLDVVVAGSYGTQDGVGGGGAVGFELGWMR